MGYRLFFGRHGLGVTSGGTAGSACRRRSFGEGPGRAVVRAQHLGRAGCSHLQSVLVRVMAGLFVIGLGNVGARVGKGMPRHKDVATAQEPRRLLARTRKAPPIDGGPVSGKMWPPPGPHALGARKAGAVRRAARRWKEGGCRT